jgi:aminoglycoside phosphotransferase
MTKDHETEPDNLVERLENSKGWPNLGKAAAARIRALEAEKKELALDVLAAQGQAADLEAENARLRYVLSALIPADQEGDQ